MVKELNELQHQELIRLLNQRKLDLLKQLDSLEQNAELPVEQARTDSGARMNAVQENAMAQAGRKQVQGQLRAVLAALAADENGDYGICQRCDEPIPFERLRIMPESLFCVNCQAQRELV